jgi:hypothetical protein
MPFLQRQFWLVLPRSFFVYVARVASTVISVDGHGEGAMGSILQGRRSLGRVGRVLF